MYQPDVSLKVERVPSYLFAIITLKFKYKIYQEKLLFVWKLFNYRIYTILHPFEIFMKLMYNVLKIVFLYNLVHLL